MDIPKDEDIPKDDENLVLAKLVKLDDVKASICLVDSAQAGLATCAVRLLTAKILMVAELETKGYKPGAATNWTVKEAWARPLRSIVAYELKSIDPLSVEITFADLERPVVLPGFDVGRQKSDEFVRQVRDAIG